MQLRGVGTRAGVTICGSDVVLFIRVYLMR